MTRVKKGLIKVKRHKKILKLAKGYRGSRSKLVRTAKEAVLHAGAYAFAGRKQRKQQKRTSWIMTINAALEEVPYNKFIKDIKAKNIALDRKILAEIAKSDLPTFKKIAKSN